MRALTVLAVACVGAWLGIVCFFSFAVAPTLFRMVERTTAGEAVAVVLPRYYTSGLMLAVVALAALVLRLAREPRGLRRGGVVSCVTAALLVAVLAWSLFTLLPRAEAARRARDDTAFAVSHRQAVSLNLVAMLCCLALLGAEALRRERRSPTE
jgi:hypothetical protein